MPKRRKLNKTRLGILIVILILILGIGAGCGMLIGLVRNLPSWKPGDLITEATSFVYDYQGNYIGKLHETEDRIPVDYNEVPHNLKNAFLAIEDIRFFQHHGISIRDLLRAAYIDITHGGKSSQGGSTITQQLVKNAILENREKTYKRKIQEALLAIEVERKYTKEEIFSFYLNEIYFGHGAYGVQAASQVYFGKDVKNLTLAEAAMLAGIVRNPKAYSPYLNAKNAKIRREVVLTNMLKYGQINQKEFDAANKEPFHLVGLQERHRVSYPWFMDYVVMQSESLLKERGFDSNDLYTGGLKVYTTLDPQMQANAEKAFKDSSNFPNSKSSDQVQGAMVVMDSNTGAIRAIVGGREYLTKRGLNRAIQMRRQPGSSIKPIAVYAPALENGYSPASVIDDVPISIGYGNNTYQPGNDDGTYRGLISIREALQYSVNVPAVRLLHDIGVDTGFKFAKKMGLTLSENDKNLALALGGIHEGVTPLEMASAYTAFANGGKRCPPIAITKITDRKGNVLVDNTPNLQQVMTPETAYLMTDMLETVVNAGTGTKARIYGHQVAGKTGTTQLPDRAVFKNLTGNKDSWFCGYTPEYVGVVWEGYDKDFDKNNKPQYLYKAYGGRFPAKIFHDVISAALEKTKWREFTKPNDIVYAEVDSKSGLLPSRNTPSRFISNEIFTKANLPTKFSDVWATTSDHRVFLKRKEPWQGTAPQDAYLEKPIQYNKSNSAKPKDASAPPATNPDGTIPPTDGTTNIPDSTNQPQDQNTGAPPTSGNVNQDNNSTVDQKTY